MPFEKAIFAAAWVIGSLGVVLFLWAMFWDRSRGRLRCPKCWYDMRGAPEGSLTCSECGHDAKQKQRLHRTRRRKRWGVLAVFLLILAFGSSPFGVRIRSEGWTGVVPTTAMIIALPWTDDERLEALLRVRSDFSMPQSAQMKTVQQTGPSQWIWWNMRRGAAVDPSSPLWDWQWRLACRRAATGMASTRRSMEARTRLEDLLCYLLDESDFDPPEAVGRRATSTVDKKAYWGLGSDAFRSYCRIMCDQWGTEAPDWLINAIRERLSHEDVDEVSAGLWFVRMLGPSGAPLLPDILDQTRHVGLRYPAYVALEGMGEAAAPAILELQRQLKECLVSGDRGPVMPIFRIFEGLRTRAAETAPSIMPFVLHEELCLGMEAAATIEVLGELTPEIAAAFQERLVKAPPEEVHHILGRWDNVNPGFLGSYASTQILIAWLDTPDLDVDYRVLDLLRYPETAEQWQVMRRKLQRIADEDPSENLRRRALGVMSRFEMGEGGEFVPEKRPIESRWIEESGSTYEYEDDGR